MADLHDRNDVRPVIYREDSAVVALPDAIGVVGTGQLLAARRTRVERKLLQRGGEALPQSLRLDPLEFLRRARPDDQPIAGHAASCP